MKECVLRFCEFSFDSRLFSREITFFFFFSSTLIDSNTKTQRHRRGVFSGCRNRRDEAEPDHIASRTAWTRRVRLFRSQVGETRRGERGETDKRREEGRENKWKILYIKFGIDCLLRTTKTVKPPVRLCGGLSVPEVSCRRSSGTARRRCRTIQ